MAIEIGRYLIGLDWMHAGHGRIDAQANLSSLDHNLALHTLSSSRDREAVVATRERRLDCFVAARLQ
jgi:hypothetical protein